MHNVIDEMNLDLLFSNPVSFDDTASFDYQISRHCLIYVDRVFISLWDLIRIDVPILYYRYSRFSFCESRSAQRRVYIRVYACKAKPLLCSGLLLVLVNKDRS